MNLSELRWDLHRHAMDRLGWLHPFSRTSGRRRMLFITERDPICHMQFFPFWHYRRAFSERFRIELRELPLRRFLAGGHPYHDVDAVCFQTWFDLDSPRLLGIVERIRREFPGARLAYLDWFAPSHLRYATELATVVDVYLKKQVLRDRSAYEQPIYGDTNLSDHYARRLELADYRLAAYPVPPVIWDKLCLGTHFAFSPHMRPRFLARFPEGTRDLDLHARIATQGSPWYAAMRGEAFECVSRIEGSYAVACRGRVGRNAYFDELNRSKLCFSPFGYGEICWRDFEAMFSGSLLLKPDMSHLACQPEVFFPGETYVPLAWDLSDLEDKVAHYLSRPAERARIARNAFELLANYFRNHGFLDDVRPLLCRLGLMSATKNPSE